MGFQIAPYEDAIFRGKNMPEAARRHSAVSCTEMADTDEMLLGRFGLGCIKGSTWVQIAIYERSGCVHSRGNFTNNPFVCSAISYILVLLLLFSLLYS